MLIGHMVPQRVRFDKGLVTFITLVVPCSVSLLHWNVTLHLSQMFCQILGQSATEVARNTFNHMLVPDVLLQVDWQSLEVTLWTLDQSLGVLSHMLGHALLCHL